MGHTTQVFSRLTTELFSVSVLTLYFYICSSLRNKLSIARRSDKVIQYIHIVRKYILLTTWMTCLQWWQSAKSQTLRCDDKSLKKFHLVFRILVAVCNNIVTVIVMMVIKLLWLEWQIILISQYLTCEYEFTRISSM